MSLPRKISREYKQLDLNHFRIHDCFLIESVNELTYLLLDSLID